MSEPKADWIPGAVLLGYVMTVIGVAFLGGWPVALVVGGFALMAWGLVARVLRVGSR